MEKPKVFTSDVYSVKITNSAGDEIELEIVECPECCGMFGVDTLYLEHKSDIATCPMCKTLVDFNWYEKE